MKTHIHVEDTFTISEGVAIVLSKEVETNNKDMAQALRGFVYNSYQEDDAGCDWFYDEEECLVFIGGEREWVASKEPLHVHLMKIADMLDGKDYSAKGNDC